MKYKSWLRKSLLILLMTLCVFPTPLTAHATHSGDLQADKPSQAEILEKSYEITSSTVVFDENPSVSAPYSTGILNLGFLESGLSYLNFHRYVAGLPMLQLSEELNRNAQYGAVLTAANNQMSHYPVKPADMDEAFFEEGYAAASSSNLYSAYGYAEDTILWSAVDAFMADENVKNMGRVGHRQWILQPKLLNVGFGYAQAISGTPKRYVALKVFDKSGRDVEYDFISWPASGHFPMQLNRSSLPWSVTLNLNKYKSIDMETLRVTLTRESDGKQWVLDKNTGDAVSMNLPFLTTDGDTMVFRPAVSELSSYEDTYTVNVSGIFMENGAAAELNYAVDIFNLEAIEGCTFVEDHLEASCTQQGHKGHLCRFCGKESDMEYFEPLGHDWNNGELTTEPSETEHGVVTYQCRRCQEKKTQTVTLENPFVDVPEDTYYTDAVKWAVEQEITQGVSDFQFAPEESCTRAQIVTFLWRAAGCPQAVTRAVAFEDVEENTWYTQAVQWAVEQGITNGYGSETIFNPNGECTRGQIATFLYRYFEEPGTEMEGNPFEDVDPEAFYFDAVLWAVEQGITNGFGSDTVFNPNGNCTRAQNVTFLYRALAE